MDTKPKIKKYPIKKVYENKDFKVRKCESGTQDDKDNHKTVMLVGETGAGKSTLIDAMCNYIFDTNWDDRYRYKLIDEQPEEEQNAEKGQSESQTEWITIYTINNDESDLINFTLNIIDTPGFGDTRGIGRDQTLVDQIRILFEKQEKHEIDSIDAVCFVVKAANARLTKNQRYIFNSILSIFGKDIEENIFVMITFHDGTEPKVLDALKAFKLSYRKAFTINNSALYESNQGPNQSKMGKIYWDQGKVSFENLFSFLDTLNPKSLILTSEVLEKRKHLKNILGNLENKVKIKLTVLADLRKTEDILETQKSKKEDNKHYRYTESHETTENVPCEEGTRATYCTICEETCHDDCIYGKNDGKAECSAMDKNKKCKQCPKGCDWKEHISTNFIKVTRIEEREHVYENKRQRYYNASTLVEQTQEAVKTKKVKYEDVQTEVKGDVKQGHAIILRLREIALKPEVFTEKMYIEELIVTEKNDPKEGWEERIEELKKLKKEAEILEAEILKPFQDQEKSD